MKAAFHRMMAVIHDASEFFLTGDADDAAMAREAKSRAAADELQKKIDDNAGNTFEKMKEALKNAKGDDTTSPMGKLLKDAAAAQDKATKNDRTIKALEEARRSIVAGNGFARETNESLEKANAKLTAIDNKTPEIATRSEFLGETANMLSESIENILGIGKDTTSADMLQELKIANEQRAAQEANNLTPEVLEELKISNTLGAGAAEFASIANKTENNIDG